MAPMKSQSSPVPPSSAAGAVSAAASPASADGLSARSEATFVSAFAARSSRAAETTGASAAVSFFVSVFVSAAAFASSPPALARHPLHCPYVQCHDEALFMFACELWRSRFLGNGTKLPSQKISIHCRSIFNNFQGKSIIVKMIKQVQFQAPFSEKRLPAQKITAFWLFGFLAFSCHNVRNRCNSRHNSCVNSPCIELLPHTTVRTTG